MSADIRSVFLCGHGLLGAWFKDLKGTRGHAPKRCSTFSTVNKSSHLDISITIGLEMENSSDLSSGDSPQFKSDEFSVSNPIVIEIQLPQLFNFFNKVSSFSELYPGVSEPHEYYLA